MKADEPMEPLVKFGLPASEQHRIVERHEAVSRDRHIIADLHFAHMLAVGPALCAAFARVGRPEPVVIAKPEPAAPDDLRAALGLR